MNYNSDEYHLLIENLPDAFAYHQIVKADDGTPVDYVFLEVNSAFEEMTGLKRGEIIGKKVTVVLPDIIKSEFDWIGTYGPVALSGEPVRFDSFSEPLGRWYEVCAYSDKPGFFATVFRDISAAKEKTSVLKSSEKGYKYIANNIPDMVVRFDTKFRHVYVNRAVENFFGLSSNIFFGKTLLDFTEVCVSKEEFNQLHAMHQTLRNCLESGEEQHITVSFTLTEEERHLFTRIVPERKKGGEIVSLLAITADITERKQAEEAMRLNSFVLNQINDLVTITNLEGDILYVNQAEADSFNFPKEKLIGANIDIFGENPEKGATQKEIREMTIRDGTWRGEVINYSTDGQELIFDCRTQVIYDEQGKPIALCGVSTDITEQKRTEEEIRALNEELEERVKERTAQLEAANRELDAFTHSASHDLRGPLNRIDGFSRILFEDYSEQLDQQGQDYLRRISNSSRHMSELIDDLLKLSNVSQHQISREPVELSALVNIKLKELQSREPDRQVETVVAPGLVTEADTALLRIALENLLNNAWKFSADEALSRIEFGSTIQNGIEVFYIRDNGTGFDMKHAEKLFTAFQRLHDTKNYPGTGVGLSIVSRIISRHGGDIWAEGEVGKGACFYFTLP